MGKLVEFCSIAYFVVILVELAHRRKWLRFLLEALVLVVLLALALFFGTAGNGAVSMGGPGNVSFGAPGTSPIATIAIMFVATVLGIAARFIFYLEKNQFSWIDLLKPIAISPMVLLPLMGSVQTTAELSSMQIISFSLLAFQNGFFWQAVLAAAKPASVKPVGA